MHPAHFSKKMPKNQIQFGSLESLQSPVPHVVFLISRRAANIRQIIIKILLLFQFHLNPDFTWSFEMINSDSNLLKRKTCLGLDSDSLHELEDVLSSEEGEKKKAEIPFKIADLTRILGYLSIQAGWNRAGSVTNQTPLKKPDSAWTDWKGNVKLRNYLFVLAPLPTNLEELQEFEGNSMGTSQEWLLDTISHELLQEKLWISMMKARIALYWICDFSVRHGGLIESWFNVLMGQFGGCILSQNTVFSQSFISDWTEFMDSGSIVLHRAKHLFSPTSQKAALLDSIDKTFMNIGHFKNPRLWSGIALIKDVSGWPTELPSSLHFTLSAK